MSKQGSSLSKLASSLLQNRFIRSASGLLLSRLNTYSGRLDHLLFHSYLKEAGVRDVEKINTWTKERELRVLYNLASSCPTGAAALEIGSYLGASTCYLAGGLAHVNGHLFCVDSWQNETMPDGLRDTFAEFQKNTHTISRLITPIRKRSAELSELDIRTPLHLVFIDGDHSYPEVKRDFNLVRQWLAEDGKILFHDFGHSDFEGVSRVVGEALATGEWIMSGFVGTLAWIRPAKWSQPSWVVSSFSSEGVTQRIHHD